MWFLCFYVSFLEYFSQHLGEYENVLAALEDLNVSILKAMDKTKKVSDLLNLLYCFGKCIYLATYTGNQRDTSYSLRRLGLSEVCFVSPHLNVPHSPR